MRYSDQPDSEVRETRGCFRCTLGRLKPENGVYFVSFQAQGKRIRAGLLFFKEDHGGGEAAEPKLPPDFDKEIAVGLNRHEG
jgi:hypothetical protein